MEKRGPVKPAEVLFPGRVTQVIDPHYFWMLMGSADRVACFLKIQKDMQTFCESHWSCVSDADSLTIGQLVLVDTELTDVRYRRAQVTRISSESADISADIFYIDYGNTEVATLDKICTEFPPIVKSVPPMAMRCCLAGVQPIAKTWTSRGIKTFTKLTAGVTLQTLVIYADIGYLLVSLYGRDGGNPRSISHQLLDEDVALPIENNEVPEYVSEIPAFMALFPAPPTDAVGESGDDRSGKDMDHLTGKENQSPPTKPAEKYIPPGRKQSGSSPGSATRNGPVHDFFPFENVSTYPPTPTDSPTKSSSIGKGSSPGSSEGSYFSRSPGRDYFQPDYYKGDQHYGSPGKTENNYRGDYNNSSYDRSPQKVFQASGSPRSYSNIDTASREPGSGQGHSRNGDVGGNSKGYNSNANISGYSLNKLQNGNVNTFMPPFFQPKQPYNDVTQMNFSKSSNPPQLTPPTAYEHHSVEPVDTRLTPPGYYESHTSPRKDYNQRNDNSYAADYQNHGYNGSYNTKASHSRNVYEKPYQGSYPGSYDSRNNNKENDRYNDKDRYSERYTQGPVGQNLSPNRSSYAEEKTKGSPHVRLQIPDTSYTTPTSTPSKQPGAYHSSDIRDTSRSTPSKSPGSFYSSKASPISPESPAIANFDMNDIEHTMNVSTIGLHQRSHQQKLMALQEEAEDIARETKEQMHLVSMARLGRSTSEQYGEDYQETVSPEVFDKISEEIRDASSKENLQFLEEMKRSPVKRRLPSDSYSNSTDRPAKLEELPHSYLADIDFSVAVREALESSKTEGMENTRVLLEEIVESLKTARVEKQLYDVIALLLSTAINDYNLYHVVVMETICQLNIEFDIKDTVAKALKKQQDLHVRVPLPKKETHVDFCQVMAHVYNLSLDWRDSNSSIQDSILNTIERWIMFNNKGLQSGQTEKENVFLDCFTAFWEVSGEQLRKHNHTVYLRLQDEVKKKLLNDNVTRCIKERLLSILLEMFTVVDRPASSDMFTQTPKRTMIPSSCQVKPVVCDKGTMTKDEDQLYHDLIFSPDDRFQQRTESRTPEISLRPARSWAQEYHSTPNEDHNSYTGNKPHKDTSLGPSTSRYSENSYMESSYSVYETPDQSFADRSVPVSDSISNIDSGVMKPQGDSKLHNDTGSTRLQRSVSDEKQDLAGKPKSWASVATETTSAKVKEQEVKESSSSSKTNIVDWFEYNPEPEAKPQQTVISKTSKKSNKSKLASKKSSLTDIAKDFMSPSKSPKDSKQKSSPKHESVAEKLAKTSDLEHKLEKLTVEDKVVTGVPDDRGVHNDDLVSATAKPDVPPNVIDTDNKKDDSKQAEASAIGNSVVGHSDVTGTVEQKESLDWWEKSEENKLADTHDTHEVLVPAEEMIHVKKNDDFGFEDEFDDDDDPHLWEFEPDSDSDPGHDVITSQNKKPDNYEKDFPETDLHVSVKTPIDYGAPASTEVVNNEYDRDYPDLDLASYIGTAEPQAPPEPAMRWRPGVRKCTLCGDTDHTTNQCPESASKLFF